MAKRNLMALPKLLFHCPISQSYSLLSASGAAHSCDRDIVRFRLCNSLKIETLKVQRLMTMCQDRDQFVQIETHSLGTDGLSRYQPLKANHTFFFQKESLGWKSPNRQVLSENQCFVMRHQTLSWEPSTCISNTSLPGGIFLTDC